MLWNPIILGIIGDFYSLNLWVLLPIGAVGFLLCCFRFKPAWIVLPVVWLGCGFFLTGFLEKGNYKHISRPDSDLIPNAVFRIFVSALLPVIGALLGRRKQSRLN